MKKLIIALFALTLSLPSTPALAQASHMWHVDTGIRTLITGQPASLAPGIFSSAHVSFTEHLSLGASVGAYLNTGSTPGGNTPVWNLFGGDLRANATYTFNPQDAWRWCVYAEPGGLLGGGYTQALLNTGVEGLFEQERIKVGLRAGFNWLSLIDSDEGTTPLVGDVSFFIRF